MTGISNSLNNSSNTFAVGANALTPSSTTILSAGLNQNAGTAGEMSNLNSGNAALSQWSAKSDTARATVIAGSSTNATTRFTNRAEFGSSTTTAGVNLTSASTTGDVRIYVQGNNLAATMSSASVLSLTNPLPVTSGGTGLASTTANQLLYSSATNTIAGLATATSGILNTDGSGVPSITSTPTIGGLVTIAGSAATMLQVNSTAAAGATFAPVLVLFRNVASASGNSIGGINFNCLDSASATVNVITLRGVLTTNTSGALDSEFKIINLQSGSGVTALDVLRTGCQIRGNNTNTVAPAGYMGQIITSSVATSSVSLTTTTAAQITSISITAGNWLVFGIVGFVPATSVATDVTAGINVTTATFTTSTVDYSENTGIAAITGTAYTLATPVINLSLASTTTYYLNGAATFAGTCTAGGKITAVRIG